MDARPSSDRSLRIYGSNRTKSHLHGRETRRLAGLYAGVVEEAWAEAADLSAQVHIEYRDKLFDTVFAVCPEMYDDMWTGGKCMYKTEPS